MENKWQKLEKYIPKMEILDEHTELG